MNGPIVVPLDGSELAERAVPVASLLARALGTELHLVHVRSEATPAPIYVEGLPIIDEELRPLRGEHERAYLGRARERLAPGAGVSTVVVEGPVASALARYAGEKGASLLVLTTHGRGGFERAWLGSVAHDLMRVSPAPILLLKPEPGSRPGPFRRMLLPLDGSPLAESILDHAVRLARLDPACRIVLTAVVPPVPFTGGWPTAAVGSAREAELLEAARSRATAYLARTADALEARGLKVHTRVEVATNVGAALLEAAREESADLVALSTHGRSGLGRLALGSVADKIVRGGRTPVLLFRPADRAA